MKIENKKQKNRKTQKIVISLCLLRPCLLRVLWCSVCFCMGHFVMVPINLTCPHCLQHFFFEHLLHLYFLTATVVIWHLHWNHSFVSLWAQRFSLKCVLFMHMTEHQWFIIKILIQIWRFRYILHFKCVLVSMQWR